MIEHLSFMVAWVAGFLSFFSPCVLPLVPSYLLSIAGLSFKEFMEQKDTAVVRRRVMVNSLFFILGFSMVFVFLGFGMGWLGQVWRGFREWSKLSGGLIIIVLGFYVAGVFEISFLNFEQRLNLKIKGRGVAGAFLLGIIFAAAWTPCVGPILGSILLLAGSADTAWMGGTLLLFYALGLALPFFVMAMLINLVLHYTQKISRFIPVLKVVSGVFLVVVGIWFLLAWFGKVNLF